MGGLVCTHALLDQQFSGLGFSAVLTIGTPFYGTSTHQERFFKGEELLNGIYGRKNVVRIIASLPGPYTLMFLTKAIFDRDHQRLNLTKYPQYDPHDKSEAEPYDPAMNRRYPTTASAQHIAYARSELLKVAEPINPNIASVFFNVR